MKILFLTQWWQPERCFKGLPFARSLAEKGHDIQVLTGFPNYPTGKIFPPYRLRLFQREDMEGIRVNRVFLYPSHDQSVARRIIHYLSFMISTLLLGPFLVKKADVVFVYNLVTLFPFAAFMKMAYGAKIVYDIQDIWPESITSSGMMKMQGSRGSFDRLCKWIYSRADAVTVLSAGFKKHLARCGVPSRKMDVVFNWCDESAFPSRAFPNENEKEEKKTLGILYAGTMGPAQDLESVIESAAICRERKLSVSFRLVGYGILFDKLRSLVRVKELDNCEVLPGRPMDEMGEEFSRADIFLVHLKDKPLFRITIPSKVQAYLYLGKPVLAAVTGDAAALIEEAGAGIACLPGHPSEIADTVEKFLRMPPEQIAVMGKNGRSFYEQRMSKARGVAAYDSLFRRLAAGR